MALMVNNEIASTKSFFQDINIPLSDEWLECCINWVKEEKPQCTEKELRSSVYDQWLIFDLREVKVPQLPPNVTKIEKLIINKPLTLQMMLIMDISKSKLQQLNDIRNAHALTRDFNEDENIRNNVTSNKRVLQMVLTDGVQEIKAMEYKPIDCLNLNLSPGIKICINHPVTIRHGTIMLESEQVQLLGGEVEDILITNAAENILAKSLNLPINPNPRFINDKTMMNQLVTTSEPISNQIKTDLNKSKVQNNISDDLDRKSDVKFNVNDMKSIIDEPLSDEIDELLEIEQELLQATKIKIETKTYSTHNIDAELNLADLTDDFFTPWDNENEPKNEPLSIDNEDKIYTLAELKQIIALNRHGIFTTFAKFKSVIKKLTIKDSGGWFLQISIEAENEELIVNVHDCVVTEMSGKSSEEMLQLKKRVQMKDEEAKDNVMKSINDVRIKLQDLNSMMEIEYNGDEEDEVPCIVKIL